MRLECSTKGDKRFSALVATVKYNGTVDTIENHYQWAKLFNGEHAQTRKDAKGQQPTSVLVNGLELEPKFLTPFYKMLWIKYLDNNPLLVAHASAYNEFTDMFRGNSINCQADVIKQYVKEGRASVMADCKELITVLKEKEEEALTHIRIALTGHRPEKLGGYDNNHPLNLGIAAEIRKHLLTHLDKGRTLHIISGMALGADTLFALVGLKLRDKGYPVTVEAAIPCQNHTKKWTQESTVIWQDIVDRADKVTLVSDKEYNAYLMQVRNEYMVDNCDELIAIWNGTSGGTYNCVKYAKPKKVKITVIDPRTVKPLVLPTVQPPAPVMPAVQTPTAQKTTVVNKHHNVPFDVYIGRGSKWGNPFTHIKQGTQAQFVVASRDEAVKAYREWIMTQPELLNSLHELKGKTLACFCAPQACHGHVLAELADSLGEPTPPPSAPVVVDPFVEAGAKAIYTYKGKEIETDNKEYVSANLALDKIVANMGGGMKDEEGEGSLKWAIPQVEALGWKLHAVDLGWGWHNQRFMESARFVKSISGRTFELGVGYSNSTMTGDKDGYEPYAYFEMVEEAPAPVVIDESRLIYVDGDLLASDCSIIMHQVNCQGVMGSGIAKQIRDRFPLAYEEYMDNKQTPEERLGSYTSAWIDDKDLTIVNLYGQLTYGRDKNTVYTKYNALEEAIEKFLVDKYQIRQNKIGVPFNMGCGLANGNWAMVSAILEKLAYNFDIHFHVYKYNPTQANAAYTIDTTSIPGLEQVSVNTL